MKLIIFPSFIGMRIAKKNEIFDLSVKFNVIPGVEYYLVVAFFSNNKYRCEYDVYDFLGLFASREEADICEDRMKKYYRPGCGNFEVLSHIEIFPIKMN